MLDLTVDPFWGLVTAILCGVTFVIHTVLGTREVLPALKTLDEAPRLTLFLGWHGTSVALFVMTMSFAAPLAVPEMVGAFVSALFLTVGALLLCVAMNLFLPVSSWKILPQWALFAPITITGLLALL